MGEETNSTALPPVRTLETPVMTVRANTSAAPSLNDMMAMAVSGGNIAMLDKLMELHQRNDAFLAAKAFDAAIARAKARIKVINKSGHVGFMARDANKPRTDYDHETLADIAKEVDPILGDEGLSYRFRPTQANGEITVTCIIAHHDGHREESQLAGMPDTSGNKNGIQAIGSTCTFLQRYLLKMALGLAAAKLDDDGAGGKPQPGMERVSEDELNKLLELADDAEVNKKVVCEWAGVADFPSILAKDFGKVKQALERKLAAVRQRDAGDGEVDNAQ